MIIKDTFNLIKQTKKRFLTIVAIVLIGVAFMMGLTSTSTIMRESVDTYNKQTNLHDYQIYSNYGFCEEDIEEFRKLDFVKDVYASKQIDSYCLINDGEVMVSRFREIDTNVNKIVLKQGRMPYKNDEVVVINPRDYQVHIGDKLKLNLEDEEILDSLLIDEFKVVGIGESSEYMSKFLSSSNYKNLDLNAVIYGKNDVFISDYYTCVYLTVEGSSDYISGTKDYFNFIDNVDKKLESFRDKQESYNKNRIIDEATSEIEDAKNEFNKKKADGQKELNDAKKQLEEAWQKIIDGQIEIEDGIKQLDDAQKQVDSGYLEIENNKKLIADGKKQVVDALSDIPIFKDKNFDQIYSMLEPLFDRYYSLVERIDVLESKIEEEIEEYWKDIPEDIQEIILSLKDKYSPDEIRDKIDDYITDLKQLNGSDSELAKALKQLEEAQNTINDGRTQLEDAKVELENGKKEYNDGKSEYEKGVIEFNKKIKEAEEEIKEAEEDLKDLKDAKWTILNRDLHYTSYMFKNTCSQMYSIGIVMPLLFFLVAALVCMTTMTRLVDEQRSQNGIYSALGYSKKYIICKYLLYVLFASLLGEIPGILIGMEIFPTVIYLTWRLLYQLPEICMSIPLIPLIVSMCSFSLLMMIVTYFVLKDSLKEKPAQLMRPKSPKLSKAVFLEKIGFIWKRLSFTSKITARNLIRYKSRFFMTVIGVAGCTGLLVLGWGIKDSIGDIVNVQYGTFFNYDYTINLDNNENIEDIYKEINSSSNVNVIVPQMNYMSKIKFNENKESTINAVILNSNDFNKIFNLRDYITDEILSLRNDGVIITKKFAETNKLNVGDYISVESKNGHPRKLKINSIATMYFQHYIFISEDLYKETYENEIEYNSIAIKCDNVSDNLLQLPNKYDSVNSVDDFSAFTNQFNVMIEALDLIIAVIIITAGALAFVVLINLIQVNISERIREIATFKVLGFKNSEINTYIFKEIVILTIIGAILGLPLGKIELKFVMKVIDMDMVMFPTNIYLPSYLYGFGITMLFTIITLLIFRKPLRNINMIESLKSVE